MNFNSILRVTIFCPPEYSEPLISAIKGIVTTKYGSYEDVFWKSSNGYEQFTPTDIASPTEGKAGEVSVLPSVKIEFSIPEDESILEKIMEKAVVIPIHPWETPVVIVSNCREVHK